MDIPLTFAVTIWKQSGIGKIFLTNNCFFITPELHNTAIKKKVHYVWMKNTEYFLQVMQQIIIHHFWQETKKATKANVILVNFAELDF